MSLKHAQIVSSTEASSSPLSSGLKSDRQLPVTVFVDIMKYMDVKSIVCRLMVLNKDIRTEI